MFLICVMLLCFLCILVIILNFMSCIGLCSNCFSYWVARKRIICCLGTTRHTTFTIHCLYIVCVTNKFDILAHIPLIYRRLTLLLSFVWQLPPHRRDFTQRPPSDIRKPLKNNCLMRLCYFNIMLENTPLFVTDQCVS